MTDKDAKRWLELWEKAAIVELQAENEQLRDALADRDQELARVEDRLEAVRVALHLDDDQPINPHPSAGGNLSYLEGWDDAVDVLQSLVLAVLSDEP